MFFSGALISGTPLSAAGPAGALFRISFAAKPTTEEQIGYLHAYHRLQIDTRREKDPQCNRVHDEMFLASDRPHLRKLAQSLQELNLT